MDVMIDTAQTFEGREALQKQLDHLDQTPVSQAGRAVAAIFKSLGGRPAGHPAYDLVASTDPWVDLMIAHADRFQNALTLAFLMEAASRRKRWEVEWLGSHSVDENGRSIWREFPLRWYGVCRQLLLDGGSKAYRSAAIALMLTNDFRKVECLVGDVLTEGGFTRESIEQMPMDDYIKTRLVEGCPVLSRQGPRVPLQARWWNWREKHAAWRSQRPSLLDALAGNLRA